VTWLLLLRTAFLVLLVATASTLVWVSVADRD
jgi:hypothetical protein